MSSLADRERAPGIPSPGLDFLKPDSSLAGRHCFWFVPALLAALITTPTLWNGLACDDPGLWLRPAPSGPAQAFRETLGFRSLALLSHLADRAMWGNWLPGYRLTSILLYATSTALASLVASRVAGSRRIGLVTGLCFAVHPVHVEAVASLANRKDLLASIWVFLAMLAWCRMRPSAWRSLTVCLLFVLGLISKEVAAVGFAAVLVIYERLFGGPRAGSSARRWARAFRSSSPILLVAGAGGLLLLAVSPVSVEQVRQQILFESNGTIANQGHLLAAALGSALRSVGLLLAPVTMSILYPIPRVADPFEPSAQLGALLLLSVGILAVRSSRRLPTVSFGLAWTLLTFLPVSNLLITFSHLFVQERYLYLPSFGLCLAIAGLALGYETGPRVRAALVGAGATILVLAGTRTVTRATEWRSDRSLLESAREAGIRTPRLLWAEAEFQALDGDLTGAADTYERALIDRGPMASWDFYSHLRLGELYFLLGRAEESIEHLRAVLSMREELSVQLSLVQSLILAGRLDEAQDLFQDVQDRGSGRMTVRLIAAELQAALGARRLRQLEHPAVTEVR